MTMAGPLAMAAVFALICVARATGQTKDPTNSGAAPPKLVMLVYQRFSSNKTAESGKALAAAARVCANLDVQKFVDRDGFGDWRAGSAVVRSIRFLRAHRQSLCRVGRHLRQSS